MLCISLNVPWPSVVRTMMSMFSSMSSLSNHVSHLGCLYEIEENGSMFTAETLREKSRKS